MCGRYSLAVPDLGRLRERFPLGETVELRTRFNVAPGDEVLAVTTDREGSPRGELLRWGLVPPWSRSPAGSAKMINARGETVAEKPAYRAAFERFRCLIIADGFYEWRRVEGRRSQAFHITPAAGGPFAFAGLWSVWHRDEPDALRSCTIITTAANETVAPLHDRMPVILGDQAQEEAWLDAATPPAALHDLLHGLAAAETSVRAVGPAVNDARYDGPECLADAPGDTAAADQPSQASLF